MTGEADGAAAEGRRRGRRRVGRLCGRDGDPRGAGRRRRQAGRDLALFEVGVASLVNLAQSTITGPARSPRATATRTRDRSGSDVCGGRRRLWSRSATTACSARLCEALERPDLLSPPRFATNSRARRTTCRAQKSSSKQTFAGATADEWVERLAGAGVPAGIGARRRPAAAMRPPPAERRAPDDRDAAARALAGRPAGGSGAAATARRAHAPDLDACFAKSRRGDASA